MSLKTLVICLTILPLALSLRLSFTQKERFTLSHIKVCVATFLFSFQCSQSSSALVEDNFRSFHDARLQAEFSYPAAWEQREGTLSGGRTVIAFVDPSDMDTSVSIVYNNIAADYTSIGSFGGKDGIRGFILPKGIDISSKVLKENLVGNSYYLEYIVAVPDVPEKHVKTIFSLRPKDSVIGLTIQTKEKDYKNNRDLLDQIEESYSIQNAD